MEEVALDVESDEVGRRRSYDPLYQVMRLRLDMVSDNSDASGKETSNSITIHKVLCEGGPTDEELKNEELPYDPRLISIGPLHRGKHPLSPMEEFKWSYLHDILVKKGKASDLRSYIEAVRSKLEAAKECYRYKTTDTTSFITGKTDELDEDDEFTMMLVLDGIFLIQFLIKSRFPRYDDPGKERYVEVVDDLGWKLSWIKHDILLLENQLPFFVLQDLYAVFSRSCRHSKLEPVGILHSSMVEVAIDYLFHTELWDQRRSFSSFYSDQNPPTTLCDSNPSHLLHLYHALIFQFQPKPLFNLTKNLRIFLSNLLFNALFYSILFLYPLFSDSMYPTKISTATELEEAGVRFEGSFMDLCFKDDILYVPIFSLNYQSFSLLKNLMAMEVYNSKLIPPYVYSYAEFLTELIKTAKDLEIMEDKNIIKAQSKEEGTRLVDKLLKGLDLELNAMFVDKNKRYRWQRPRERVDCLKSFCEQPRHRWRRDLVKKYFSSPWSFIGLLVGTLVVVFTAFQTIYTILSYYFRR